MKRIDRLIVGELVGPFLLGVAMFSSLLLAATYLGRITEYIVQGVPPALIGKITLLLLPPIFIKTFSMATLLGSLLAFGRLSGDSEIVACRASGASIYRIIAPVAGFAAVIALVTFILNDTLVPYAAKQARQMTESVSKSLNSKSQQSVFQPIFDESGKRAQMMMADDFNLKEGTLTGVTLVNYDQSGEPDFYLRAKSMKYDPLKKEEGWRIIGGAKLFSGDGTDVTTINGDVWPQQLQTFSKPPNELGYQQINDPDYFTSSELRKQITERSDKSISEDQYRNREYWFWLKFSLPLAALVFGILGAALGIRSHRAGTSAGFALAVGIMFAYMMISNLMNTWAMGGAIPSYLAAFTPVLIGFVGAIVIMWRRNIG
jgi:lipopolysaccharide export system permease protein